MKELELKFGVPPAVLPSLRQALLDHGATPLRLRARYFDTPDGRLAAHRVALRLRQEDAEWVQTLKAEGDSAISRLEDEAAAPAPPGEVPALVLSRHDGSAAHAVLCKALGADGAAQLVERLETDVERLRCVLRSDDTEMEVSLDLGFVRAGERRAEIAELEIEWLRGPVDGVFELGEAWVLHGGLWLSTLSKSQRGQRLLGEGGAPTKARDVACDAKPSGALLLRAALHSALEQVLANAGDVAEGETGDEWVHQLRIGLRRLRTVLRELGGLLRELDADWSPTLTAVFRSLGRARDAQVLGDAVQPLLEAAHAPLTRCAPATPADLRALVRAAPFQVVLLQLLALVHAGDDALSTASPEATRHAVRRRLARLHRQVLRDGARFETLPPEQQHRVRKRLKRLRYLAELVRSMWPGDAVDVTLRHLKPAQAALGRHNDLATAAAAFHDEAARDPRAWFAAGYLQAQLPRTARKAHRALAALRDAKPFWRR